MVRGISSIFLAIVTVKLFNRIWAFLQYLLQKIFCRVLGFVRKNGRIKFTGEVINGYEEILPPLDGFLSFQKWQPFSVAVEHLTRIVLIVTFGLLF